MYETLVSKRRFTLVLLWCVVVLYLILNIGIVISGPPLIAMVITLPVVNIVLISTWIIIKTLYNKANDSLRSVKRQALYIEPKPPVKYGKSNKLDYIPDIKLSDGLFTRLINASQQDYIVLNKTLEDYLVKDQIIVFHRTTDYGNTQRIKVLSIKSQSDGILVEFIKL